jgi:hypothetical protein
MMSFNCPKNFKQGRLIANRFRWIDLIIAGIGIIFSLIAIMTYITAFSGRSAYIVCALLLPGVLTVVLISPAGIYHNVLEFLIMMIRYLMSDRYYIWGGIYKNDSEQETSTYDEE